MVEQKYTILVVDDEPSVALVLRKALEQEGFTTLVAGDGEQGLQLALEQHPDVILADLRLPHMSGMDMIRDIRKDPWGKTADVIIFSNVSDVKTLQEAMLNQTFNYMVKGDSSLADVVNKVKSRIAAHQVAPVHA